PATGVGGKQPTPPPVAQGGGGRTTAPPATKTGGSPPPITVTPPVGTATPPATKTGGGPPPTTVTPPAGTATPPQPKHIADILAKNARARNVEIQKKLAEDINNYRKNTGISRVDEPQTPGKPVQGGSVAVARTDIKTLDSRPYGGASPEALPKSFKGKPGT